MKRKILGLLAVGLLAGPMAANAALLNFSLSGTTDTIEFQLDSNPTPDRSGTLGFWFDDIAVSVNGGTGSPYTIRFSAGAVGGGLGISVGFDTLISQSPQQEGSQLFTGTTAAPIFATGVWNLNTDCFLCADFTDDFTLTVSAVSTVPEPSTLALLGLGLVGMGMRRRVKAS